MIYTPKAIKIAKSYYSDEGFSHALRVADLAIHRLGSTLDQDRLYSVALLHDIVEDTYIDLGYLRQEFGDDIADDISVLSRRPEDTYISYIEKVKIFGSLYAVRVKQSDIKDHLMQKETLTDSLRKRYLTALPHLI